MKIEQRIKKLENQMPDSDGPLSWGEKKIAELFGEDYVRRDRKHGFILDTFHKCVVFEKSLKSKNE
jgi:hypothetical protein